MTRMNSIDGHEQTNDRDILDTSVLSKREVEAKLTDLRKADIEKAKSRKEKKQIQRKYDSLKDELLSPKNKRDEKHEVPTVDPALWRHTAVTRLRQLLKDNAQTECSEVKERHEKQEVEYWFKKLDQELSGMLAKKSSEIIHPDATPRSLPYEQWKQRHLTPLVKELKAYCVESTKGIEDTDQKHDIVQEYRHLTHRLRGEEEVEECTAEEVWAEREEMKRTFKAMGKERCRERNDRRCEKNMTWMY